MPRLSDERLNGTIFTSLAQASALLGTWRHDYNYHGSYSSLGKMPLAEMTARSADQLGWWLILNPVAIARPRGHQEARRP